MSGGSTTSLFYSQIWVRGGSREEAEPLFSWLWTPWIVDS